MTVGWRLDLFSHRGEGMLCYDCCWRFTQLWQVPGLRSCWELELLPSWCERGSSHLSFFHPAVFCEVFVLSDHTPALSTTAISQIHPSHVRGPYFHFHKLLCLLGLFPNFKSIYDWARPWFKNTSKLSQDLLCVCHGSNGLGMEWHCFVPALLLISWLPLCHFTSGGELTAVISVNFSFFPS